MLYLLSVYLFNYNSIECYFISMQLINSTISIIILLLQMIFAFRKEKVYVIYYLVNINTLFCKKGYLMKYIS